MKIQLKRSNIVEPSGSAKEPSVDQMEYGELAVNYSTEDPAVFMKDADNRIIRIAGSGSLGEFSGSYLDLTSTPTIGDGNITITSGGIQRGTFSVNQTGDVTIDLPVNSGPPGPQGVEGPIGPVGPPGPDGPVGPQGITGAGGTQGPKGDTGDRGLTGPPGPQGGKGDTGTPGPQGVKGSKGDKGNQGNTGPPGSPSSVKGPPGPPGPGGAKGNTGPGGPAGPPGPVGIRWPASGTPSRLEAHASTKIETYSPNVNTKGWSEGGAFNSEHIQNVQVGMGTYIRVDGSGNVGRNACSEKIKKNISLPPANYSSTNYIDKLSQIQLKQYQMDYDHPHTISDPTQADIDRVHLGWIAEELLAITADFVIDDRTPERDWSIGPNTDVLLAYAIEAIKNLKARIEILEA